MKLITIPVHLQFCIVLLTHDKSIIITLGIVYLIIFTLNTQDLRVGTSFVRYGAKVWNNISTDVRELGRIKFNKVIKKSLLTILELEDDYVDEKLLVRQMAKQRK